MADDDLDPEVSSAFATLDEIDPPDLTDRIFGAAPAPGGRVAHVDVGSPAGARRRWLVGIAAAVVLFVGGIGVGILLTRDGGSEPTTLPASPPTVSSPTGSTPGSVATTTAPSTDATFGSATVEPETVMAGQQITVRPARAVEPECAHIASVFSRSPDGLIQIGQMDPAGNWFGAVEAAGRTIFTVPACAMERSAAAVEYTVPVELGSGGHVICLTQDLDPNACGTFTVGDAAPGGRPPDPLAEALVDLGADVAGAPAGASTLGEARWCGAEQRIGPDPDGLQIDETARRCLLDAHLAAEPAVLVRLFSTTEGDPVVEVVRTLDDGTVETFTDSSRDDFGPTGPSWQAQTCARLATTFPNGRDGNPPTTFGCTDDGAVPLDPVAAAVPAWFTSREVLPLCGYAVRIVDVDTVQRECFTQAIEHRQPAEFADLDVIDGARTARWFRVTSTGEFEVIEQTITDGTAVWQRFACNRLDALTGIEPGYDVLPMYVPEWCTAGIDAEPPPTSSTTPPATVVTAPPGTVMAPTSPPS